MIVNKILDSLRVIKSLIFAKDLRDFSVKAFPILAKANFGLATAFLIYRNIKPIKLSDVNHSKQHRNLLVLNKPIFVEDIIASFNDCDDFSVFSLPIFVIKRIACFYLK